MRKIEKEEEKVQSQDPYKLCFHLCIVNLVIGTLYCAKQNFEFGISRIIKSLEPYAKKIETDTWFYAKRCFLAFIENVSKHMLVCKVSRDPVLSREEAGGAPFSEYISLLRLPSFGTGCYSSSSYESKIPRCPRIDRVYVPALANYAVLFCSEDPALQSWFQSGRARTFAQPKRYTLRES